MADKDSEPVRIQSSWETFDYKHEALGNWSLWAGMRARLVLQVQSSTAVDPQAITEYEIDRIELHDGAKLLIDHIIVMGHRYRRALG
jgi:hypothetical protein